MDRDEIAQLLDRLGELRRRCDLDLLLFFARHPRAMLTSETLASFLGYDLGEIADALDALLAAGFLTRQQTPAHAARMYVFSPPAPPDDRLPRLVHLAGTREGRLALRALLAGRDATRATRPEGRGGTGRETHYGPHPLDAAPSPHAQAAPGRRDEAG